MQKNCRWVKFLKFLLSIVYSLNFFRWIAKFEFSGNALENVVGILKDGCVFGLSGLGNGATINWTPLLNMLFMCGNSPSILMPIFNCIYHMSAGGKKDATFKMKQFKESFIFRMLYMFLNSFSCRHLCWSGTGSSMFSDLMQAMVYISTIHGSNVSSQWCRKDWSTTMCHHTLCDMVSFHLLLLQQ